MSIRLKHVAVIGADRRSMNSNGSWVCFVADTQREAIEQALKAVSDFGRKDYVVWVGTLDKKATMPVKYKLVDLDSEVHGS